MARHLLRHGWKGMLILALILAARAYARNQVRYYTPPPQATAAAQPTVNPLLYAPINRLDAIATTEANLQNWWDETQGDDDAK